MLVLALLALAAPSALARAVLTGDAGFVAESPGLQPGPFLYLGARQVLADPAAWLLALAVALLPWRDAVARGALLGLGALAALLWPGRPPLGEAAPALLAGLALAALALDNLGAWRCWFGWRRAGRAAGLLAGAALGLAAGAALAALPLAAEGAAGNRLLFRLGAGLGMGLTAAPCLLLLRGWRRPGGPLDAARPDAGHAGAAYPANVALLTLGFLLAGRGVAALLAA